MGYFVRLAVHPLSLPRRIPSGIGASRTQGILCKLMSHPSGLPIFPKICHFLLRFFKFRL